jgi:hypothetical protein
VWKGLENSGYSWRSAMVLNFSQETSRWGREEYNYRGKALCEISKIRDEEVQEPSQTCQFDLSTGHI